VYLLFDSTFEAAESVFAGNSAGVGGGVVTAWQRDTVRAVDSVFRGNSAGSEGGVAAVWNSSVFNTVGSLYEENAAGDLGAVIFMWNETVVTAVNCSFVRNEVVYSGGAAYVGDSSNFVAQNSTFAANRAGSAGAMIFVAAAGSSEVYNSRLRDHSNASIRCRGTGTIYASLLDLELTEGLVAPDANCVVFLYQANHNGSIAFRRALTKVVSSGDGEGVAVNFLYWSYPCREGQWSSDGIEHGNSSDYQDANGRTIDENDSFCDDDDDTWDIPDCAEPCRTCKFLQLLLVVTSLEGSNGPTRRAQARAEST